MDSYKTEEEQVEDLKRWWRENGQSTIIGIVLAIAAFIGWQAWQNRTIAQHDNAAGLFQNLVSAAAAINQTPTTEMLTTAKTLADALKKDYASTPYAQYAALYNAKFAVDEKKFADAETELRWVLEQKPEREMVLTAQLRLARVLIAQTRYDEALEILSKAKDQGSYAWEFADVKGDILKLKNDNAGALAAYTEAREALSQLHDAPEKNPLLDMKIKALQALLLSVEKPAEKSE